MSSWYKKWKIKMNHEKSHLTFTLKRGRVPLDNNNIPKATSSCYLGLILEKRLTWTNYLKILLNA